MSSEKVITAIKEQIKKDAWPCGMEERQFQSTPPAWGVTACSNCCCCSATISIHTPRVGGDRI